MPTLLRRRLPETIALAEPAVEVRLRVTARARRFTLRLGQPGEAPVLTLPPGVGEAEARDFLLRNAGWLDRALGRQPGAVAVAPGIELPVDGVPRRIATAERGRVPVLGDGVLLLPPGRAPGPLLGAWLRERARARIAPLAHGHAGRLGCRIAELAFRDTRSRWGSCSTARRISLSWRLAMAPPEVQDYVAAHEAAHLVEMNHSPRYWAVLARLMPDYAERRAWLQTQGRGLHAFCFDSG